MLFVGYRDLRLGRLLATHVDRLRRILDSLTVDLREKVATAIGHTVGSAVQEAIESLISGGARRPMPYQGARSPNLWNDAEEEWQFEDPPDHELEIERPTQPAPPARPSNPSHLMKAVTLGGKAACWWFLRRQGPLPILIAIALGLASVLSSHAGDPSHNLSGSAQQLIELTRTVDSWAAILMPSSTS